MSVGWAYDNGRVDSWIVEHREGIRVPSRHVQFTRCFFSELGIRIRQCRQVYAGDACCQVTRIDVPETAQPDQAHIQLHLFLLDSRGLQADAPKRFGDGA